MRWSRPAGFMGTPLPGAGRDHRDCPNDGRSSDRSSGLPPRRARNFGGAPRCGAPPLSSPRLFQDRSLPVRGGTCLAGPYPGIRSRRGATCGSGAGRLYRRCAGVLGASDLGLSGGLHPEARERASDRGGAFLPPPRTLLDLCSGSGALIIALARSFPEAAIDAVDISADAIAAGRENAGRLGCGRIRFYQGDLFAPLPEGSRYDLIVCNPPYVAERDAPILPPEVLCEPREALFGGEDGLLFFRRIIPEVKSRLARGGRLLIEMGAGQAEEVSLLASYAGFAFGALKDLAGIERVGILSDG